ncbi:MAG TPA: HPP family protein [Thermotogota bacterium]|nr:HPP family protein [Thermotogota bacterium]HRW34259.1 HPP family protein [Thermotogota bacterium]
MRLFNILDCKFRGHKKEYILQSLITVGIVAVVLLFLDLLADGIVVASIGASSTIAFGNPHDKTAGPRYLIGGYMFGVISGAACAGLVFLIHELFPGVNSDTTMALLGAFSVGLTMFLMVITNTEHPPASALALGLTLDGFCPTAASVAIIGISSISLIQRLLKKHLVDLY